MITIFTDPDVLKLAGFYFDSVAPHVYLNRWIHLDGFRDVTTSLLAHGIPNVLITFFIANPPDQDGKININAVRADLIYKCDQHMHYYLSPVKHWNPDQLERDEIPSIFRTILNNMELALTIYRRYANTKK